MKKPVLIFRADAGSTMGTGHLMRSAALAGMLAQHFSCKLLTACSIPQLIETVRENFEEVYLLPESAFEPTCFQQAADGYKLAVLDGYHFDKAYQSALQARGFRLAVIDDLVTEPITADLVVNHCGGLVPQNFTADPHTVFALGTGYLLLNPVFQVPANERRKETENNNCFVCLGGADPENVTLQVLQKLCGIAAFANIHIVTGAAYLHKEALQEFCAGKDFLHVHQALSAIALKAVMQVCAFAVCSPSTIALEYLSAGGVVWLKQIADNQKHIRRFLTAEGLAFDFEKDEISLLHSFAPMLDKQAVFFDGKAKDRLRKLFITWSLSTRICARRATEGDLQTCYQWVNDPEVRNQSYSSQPISLEEHTEWYLKKIVAPNCFYYILWQQGRPLAQIRFEITGEEATISYLTAPELRGQGMGSWILATGIRQLLTETAPKKITGQVKKTNLASLRSFEKLAFKKTESKAYPASFTYTMTIHGNQA
jgi:UDP-2,4-diacetamido-2,4,6-trideoxy-beta-L-altropyranose hydrolase